MQNAQNLLLQSQKNKDKITEGMALTEIGYDYRSFGNTSKSLEYNLKATELARETGNVKLIANTEFYLAHNYKDQTDYPKAIGLYLSSEETGSKLKDYELQTSAFQNLGQVYMEMNKIDSALMYAQSDYELCMRIHYYDNLSYTLKNLGSIQRKMHNSSLALSYFNLAIQEGFKTKSSKQLNWAYTAEAQYFHDINQNDSSLVYAKKAIAVVQHSEFSNFSINPQNCFWISTGIVISTALLNTQRYTGWRMTVCLVPKNFLNSILNMTGLMVCSKIVHLNPGLFLKQVRRSNYLLIPKS
jgi:tetratricopeptide (TPR) repeat protein